MAIRKVILTERELTNLIKKIVRETKETEMEESWLGDKLSDIGKGGREFFTGHKSRGDRDSKRDQFMEDLDELEEMFNENPDDFMQSDWGRLRSRLEREAEENNYKGEIVVLGKSKKVVKYEPGYSGLQHMGAGAGSGMRSSHTFGSGGRGGSLG
jgi:hypothetical protein